MIRIVIWLIGSWSCAFLLSMAGVRAATRKHPVHFYPGTQLKHEMLTSVSLYNKENCQMWFSYSFFFWINGVVGIFDQTFSAVILFLCILPGLPYLVCRYNRILKKYLKEA